ncbi:MAG: hypothetical protein ABI340_01285 [Nitrososphaera sp.]|jgi:hypothetical protein
MEHVFYFDGNEKMISWRIETNGMSEDQKRVHAEYYYDKVSIEQSKYIALHVGIFWGIGRFIIKNGDTVKVMLDLKSMFEHLATNKKTQDKFIEHRTNFILQLINQRTLDVRYQMINPLENKAHVMLNS